MSKILPRKTIRFRLTAVDKTDAITQCGSLLATVGAVTQSYADAMFERERQVPTYLGEEVTIPYGTNESRECIQRTCLGLLQFPDGADQDDRRVLVCIPIASHGEEYVEILDELTEVLMDPDAAAQLRTTTDPDSVLRPFGVLGKKD